MKLKAIINNAEEGMCSTGLPSITGCATEGQTCEEHSQRFYEAVRDAFPEGWLLLCSLAKTMRKKRYISFSIILFFALIAVQARYASNEIALAEFLIIICIAVVACMNIFFFSNGSYHTKEPEHDPEDAVLKGLGCLALGIFLVLGLLILFLRSVFEVWA